MKNLNVERRSSFDPTEHASPVRSGAQVVIIGGGPGGYEAATVAQRMGALVTLIEDQGVGGSAVLTDVVPSKTLIAAAEAATEMAGAGALGISAGPAAIDMGQINERVRSLATSQSADIRAALEDSGVRVIDGHAVVAPSLDQQGRRLVKVRRAALSAAAKGASLGEDEGDQSIPADIILLATGARPRELPSARPDGERILTWKQLYELEEVPSHLIVVGSGVTGAEFAGAYRGLGARVTLVSSRELILPGEDHDAAGIIEKVFVERGMQIERRTRAESVKLSEGGVEVTLSDGRVLEGSHCLMAVGALPNTENLGLEAAGVQTTESGHIRVDRVSRTTSYRIYAAGDCTGVLPLASVAAQQGRIAMWHALGDSLEPLDVDAVAQAVFTSPEVASVGISEAAALESGVGVRTALLPLARNPRAKMQGVRDGFVKIVASLSGVILGAVVVGPHASDLIFPLTMAVHKRMTVDEVAAASTIYPSMAGTLTEVARMLH